MKKIYILSLIAVAFALGGVMYLNHLTPTTYAATQRFYADPDDDNYGTPGDYIVRDDSERPPDGYIDWVAGHDNDNCPDVYNPNQDDVNENGIGDVCDSNEDPIIDLLSIDLNKIALVHDEVPEDFYISGIEYPTADYDASNYQVRPAHTLMLEVLHSYYKVPHSQSYSASLRLYESILDAKAIFDKHNVQHTRTVIDLDSSDKFGDDVFCHVSEDFTERNAGLRYYICGLRHVNLFVLIQGTITEEGHADALRMLRVIHSNVVNYDGSRQNPVIGDSTPPLDTTNTLPDLIIEKIDLNADTKLLTATVKNDSEISLNNGFLIHITNKVNGNAWVRGRHYTVESPLTPNESVAIEIDELADGLYELKGNVDFQNKIKESDELNNTLLASFSLNYKGPDENDSDGTSDGKHGELLQLRQRIKSLSYKISQLEQQVVDLEIKLIQKIDKALTNRLKGRILLQVEEKGEAWYVDEVTEQKFFLKDGNTAYQALKAFGLGVSTADIEKIPVGFEDRFDDVDTDGDGLADKTEEALGTDLENPDSDGDGFADGDEVRGNYNPLGPGAMVEDTSLANRLKGKILLQVEGRGQAWYVHPEDGKRYYMKDGPAAYQIMRFLSLGITNDDIRKIDVGSFE